MTHEEYVLWISKMTTAELLAYIIDNPEDLTDPYYRMFGAAVRARAEELQACIKPDSTP